MDSEVSGLIRRYSCRADDASYSFMSTTGVKVNFGINTEKMPNFLVDYCKMADDDENNLGESSKRKHNLGICEELVKKAAPIVAVHFFKFNIKQEDMEEELIKREFVLALAYSYQQVISETFNISVDTKELITAVLESGPWFSKKIACFKVELRFPHCHFDKSYQKKQFKSNVIDRLRENHVLSFLSMQPIGDWDQIIEENTDFLPLYRSVTDTSTPPGTLTLILGAMKNSKDDDAEKDLSEVFEPSDHSYIHGGEISADFLEESKDVNHWIPLFLSAFFWNKAVTLKDSGKGEKKSHSSNYDDDDYEDAEEGNELNLARKFLEMLDPEIISQNNYWCDIGRVLHKITWGSEEGLELFIDVSSKCQSDSRSKKACKNMWPKLKGGALTVKTLAWMARTNNKLDYDAWHSKWIGAAVEDALTDMTDLDLANVVYRFFWLDFTCSSMSRNEWWYFTPDTHRHVPMDGCFKLRKDITDKLVTKLIIFRADVAKRQASLGGNQGRKAKVEEKELENKITRITKLISKFKSNGARNKSIEMAKENFYVENFYKVINKDPNKTAWGNCVLELNEGRAIIRNGKPEDFITKSGLVPYRDDFSHDHPVVKELLDYLGKVFVDEEMCEYFKLDAASYLYGKNAEKHFRVWTGIKGDNSKSMMVKLMQFWWGELCVDIPLSVYTSKSKFKGSGPTPELAQMDSAHLGITAEPDEDGDLGAGPIKRCTGGDSQFGRNCNTNGGSITMTHKAVFMCNGVPNVPGVDEPTKNRMAFLLFLSKWVDEPPRDIKEQYAKRLFKKDVNFEQRLPELAEAMFWLAVQYYPKYCKVGLKAPKMVQEYAKLHWEDNDPYQSFIAERMEKVKVKPDDTLNSGNSVTASDIYPQFKTFFRTNNPQSSTPGNSQFKTQMVQRLGDQVGKRWPGWIIRDDI
jgi:phage/plasmid-associated DNA primase